MATTYLQLVNRTLRELNETELTSATFSTSRGIQTAVKDFVNKSIHDIYNEAGELPILYTETTQQTRVGQQEYALPANMRKVDWDSFIIRAGELITNPDFTTNISNWTTSSGSPSYSSSGNGRILLNSAGVYQAISTVKNRDYRLEVRLVDTSSSGSSLTIQVGTSAGDTTNLNATLSVTNTGEGNVYDSTFTATASTTYITISNGTANNLEVDYVRCQDNTIIPAKLSFMTYDAFLQNRKPVDDRAGDDAYDKPASAYRKPNYGYFGLTPIPDRSDYVIQYGYFTTHTDLSAYDDTISLPDRFSPLIIDRCKYYTYMLRSDPQHAQLADRDYQRKLKLLQVDYTSPQEYMRDDRVIAGSINVQFI